VAGLPLATAVRQAVEIAQAHQRLLHSQIDMMRGYAETTGCRRQWLLGYFGEQLPEPCEHCDTCESGTAHQRAAPGDGGDYPLNSRVRHPEWGDGVVMRVEDDRMTVLFETGGYKTLGRQVVRENELLTVLGD